jgi:creatinine amidohydrolase/Fe(II)-dependent formamide hydrolase-like protein
MSSMPANFRNLDELTRSDLLALDPARSLAVCAVSALEVHGPHLPIGSDFHQAVWMADETGRRFAENHADWTVVRHPPLPIGTDELPLPGSINFPAQTVYRSVCALGSRLADAGFRHIVITNAHGGPRHAAALEAACRSVSRRKGVAMISPAIRALHRLVSGAAFDQVEEVIGRKLGVDELHGARVGEHAGTWETSWYLAQRPELVKSEWKDLAEDHPPPLRWLQRLGERLGGTSDEPAQPGAKLGLGQTLVQLAGGLGWTRNARDGYGREGERVTYSGWPAVASPELGRAYAELSVRMCLEDVEAVVAGRMKPEEVRSIASDPLLIQPHFRPILWGSAVAAAALLVFLAFS